MLATALTERIDRSSQRFATAVHSVARELPALVSRKWVRAMLSALLVLNLLDAYFTVLFIHQMRVIPEANPLMGLFLRMGMGAIPFVFVKTLIVTAGVAVLWRRPCDLLTQAGSYLALTLYGSTVLHFYLFSAAV